MKTTIRAGALALVLAAASACSGLSDREQRTLSGGAIGAAGGAAVGVLAGGSASLRTGAFPPDGSGRNAGGVGPVVLVAE
ncbi:MAG TPA: hypothetical protein VK943_20160, partial [Arenibaculum sp.]|nr:hypothetical protein [Arenibaculum sp.]